MMLKEQAGGGFIHVPDLGLRSSLPALSYLGRGGAGLDSRGAPSVGGWQQGKLRRGPHCLWHEACTDTCQPVNPRMAHVACGLPCPQPGPACTPTTPPSGMAQSVLPDEDIKVPGRGRAEPRGPGHSVLCSDGGTDPVLAP